MFSQDFLVRRFFAYYSDCEAAEIGVHVCDPCNTDREYARVRSAGLIAEDYLSTLMVDPTDEAKWQAGINAGKIIVVPKTAGSYEPGDPKELKGYGDTKSSNGPRDFTLTFFDPTYEANYGFYNGLTNITSKVPFFRTSSLVHIADVTCSVIAKDPVADDLEEEVTWNVTCKWNSANIPSKHKTTNLAAIFACNG